MCQLRQYADARHHDPLANRWPRYHGCLAVGVDPAPKHVEGARARLKRMVSRGILTENEPGIFTLIPKWT
jgi:hypothetical protein